ncbi:MAG TPA: CRISPR-associated endonuclease Cas2 [Chloroflexota bacterium]|nr:CRISPR-associated endonuclease Cas2 [Chloroflexota bacterium]
MKTLLVYDIPDDRVRSRVADTCQDYGLHRIQYSAFFGELSANHQEELLLKLRRRVGRFPCNIQLFPIGERELRLRKIIHIPDRSEQAEPPPLAAR